MAGRILSDHPAGALEGQKVLIIGGAGMMGAAIARLAAGAGAAVILVGRRADPLTELATDISARTVVGDVVEFESAKKVLATAGHVDHIVVAISATQKASSILATPAAAAKAAFGRLWASYNVLHLAPHFVTETGSVTLISGSSGRRPGVGFGVWTTLHGAIEALARAGALELEPIRVNVVSPGGIGLRPDRQLAHHVGTPEDIAAAVIMLLTNEAMTATTIDVDGGERLGAWSGAPAKTAPKETAA